jgi:hypothetical protein
VAERKLRARKKRAYSGRAVRLSNALLAVLDRERRRGKVRSYDALLRSYLGMPDWRGNPQPLVEGCLETTCGQFYLKVGSWDEVEALANGRAVLEAVKRKTKKVSKPLRMREIP